MWKNLFNRLDKNIDRFGYWIGAYALFAGSTVMGVMAGWIASYSVWMEQFGAIGWLITGLIAFLISALGALLIAQVRLQWITASATRHWQDKVDYINPLDKEFNKVRLRLDDIAHPMYRRIANKKIYGCEIIGPASVFLHKNVIIAHNSVHGCSVVVLRQHNNGNVYPGGAFILEDVSIIHSDIDRITFFVTPDMVDVLKDAGLTFSTLTGDQYLDNL